MARNRQPRYEQFLAAVQAWQANPDVHPLRCPIEKRPLVAVKEGRRVVLQCPTCDYSQTEIPEVVIEAGSRIKPAPGAVVLSRR